MLTKTTLLAAITALSLSMAQAQVTKTKPKPALQQSQQTVQQVGEANMTLPAASPDQDGDGHDSYAFGGADCDDTDAQRFPGNVEVADPENRDEDCNPETYGALDYDGDGFVSARACNIRRDGSMNCGPDCDDRTKSIHPLQIDVLNGRDDNCNLEIDEDQTLEQVRALLRQ